MFFKMLVPSIVACSSIYAQDLANIPFQTADGKTISLGDFKGKVVVLVNVASKCGFTGQYEGLQKIYEEKKDAGLVILGFPCNDFGGQEPGKIDEIQSFCKLNYGVTFPIMEKISVKGDKQHALYKALTGPEGAFPGNIKWNFGKIIIDKEGKPINRFESLTNPDSKKFRTAIETALAK